MSSSTASASAREKAHALDEQGRDLAWRGDIPGALLVRQQVLALTRPFH